MPIVSPDCERVKPKMHVTWDSTGMFLWIGRKPVRKGMRRVYSCDSATRIRLPVSWFGGIVDEGGCKSFDLDSILFEETNELSKT